MNNKAPIGIFDSGVGGTSIWKEIHKQLPHEATVYLADSINAPYGNKTKEEILSLCIKNTEHLISLGCKIIIIACNNRHNKCHHLFKKPLPNPVHWYRTSH